jgi:hypothetical protein
MTPEASIFLSHNYRDKPFARTLAQDRDGGHGMGARFASGPPDLRPNIERDR